MNSNMPTSSRDDLLRQKTCSAIDDAFKFMPPIKKTLILEALDDPTKVVNIVISLPASRVDISVGSADGVARSKIIFSIMASMAEEPFH
jgi:hypothetical protein